jgi:hypothetical protein
MKTELSTVKIGKKIHKQLRDYCEKNGLKITFFLDSIILKTLSEEKENGNENGNENGKKNI